MRLIGKPRLEGGVGGRRLIFQQRLHRPPHADATAFNADRSVEMAAIGARPVHPVNAGLIRQNLQINTIRIRSHGLANPDQPAWRGATGPELH